jgi:hypothetical protein
MTKEITIIKNRNGKDSEIIGTVEYLVNNYFGYTLEVGQSWEHEKGNKKINRNPKSGKSLVNNLNKAVTNSAANGYSSTYFRLK